jgi:hypothetical protein
MLSHHCRGLWEWCEAYLVDVYVTSRTPCFFVVLRDFFGIPHDGDRNRVIRRRKSHKRGRLEDLFWGNAEHTA